MVGILSYISNPESLDESSKRFIQILITVGIITIISAVMVNLIYYKKGKSSKHSNPKEKSQ